MTSAATHNATSGKRQTRQKEAIEHALTEAGRPLSIEEILGFARQRHAHVSERTVFRVLNDMTKENRLVKVILPGQPPRYEIPVWEERPYFICVDCRKVEPVTCELPETPANWQLPKGYHLHGVEWVLRGTCADCAKP